MKRHPNHLFLALLAAPVLAQEPETPAPDADPGPPNVLLIISDDHAWTDYGFMGHPVVETPHLDRLAAESLTFTRGYVTTALCSPSLATILTGRFPHEHGMTGNDPLEDDRKPAGFPEVPDRQAFIDHFTSFPQLPALLGETGYLSFQTGKFWLGSFNTVGFSHGMTDSGRHGSNKSLAIGREGNDPALKFMDYAVETGHPFMVWYAPFLPHTPHTPPDRLLEKYRAKTDNPKDAAYFAMVEWLDENVGELLDYLDDKGIADNTIVVYLADNGWPNDMKGSPYEAGIRTPIMIRWPAGVADFRDDEHLAQNIDIFPTILRACGIPLPEDLPGINLLDEQAVAARDALFFEEFTHDMASFEEPELGLRSRSVIHDGWKLIRWQDPYPAFDEVGKKRRVGTENLQLYRISSDPREEVNLAESDPDQLKLLSDILDLWIKRQDIENPLR